MIRNLVLAVCLLLAAAPSWASSGRTSRSAPRSASRFAGRTKSRSATSYKTPSTKCTTCARDSRGKIARSPAARRSFQASYPCPATGKTTGACKGYVIDHVVPLKRGEERRTPIGTDVSMLLSGTAGPTATKLFGDLGALTIPFEATATIGGTHYLVAGDGNQMSVVEAWASAPAALQDPPRRADGSVDANRLRQYQRHCGFLGRVRETMSRAQV